jgi:5-methyltetrahydrofolate--homocysteine methyltransferase
MVCFASQRSILYARKDDLYLLEKKAFLESFHRGIHLLDSATGTSLIRAGMPRGCCQEAWILEHPEVIIELQRSYAEAGSEIIYAPTFQANELALGRHGLEKQISSINAQLIALSCKAAPDCLIAGNLTTLKAYLAPADENSFDRMISVYRKQIHALIQGGADLLAAETLLHPLEAKAVLHAAKEEGASTVMISFALRPDGTLRSGHDAETVFAELEQAGAAALGMNCIAADDMLPPLVKRLKRNLSIPLICKPNTGRAVGGIRPVGIHMFADVMRRCMENGAALVGGCCGTTPEHIAALKNIMQ